MYDATPMYPDGFHPIDTDLTPSWDGKAGHFTRTQRPVRYYFIDFGLSVHFQGQEARSILPVRGGDHTAPEHLPILMAKRQPQDPFATDVYYIGNLVRQEFLDVGLVFTVSRPHAEVCCRSILASHS